MAIILRCRKQYQGYMTTVGYCGVPTAYVQHYEKNGKMVYIQYLPPVEWSWGTTPHHDIVLHDTIQQSTTPMETKGIETGTIAEMCNELMQEWEKPLEKSGIWNRKWNFTEFHWNIIELEHQNVCFGTVISCYYLLPYYLLFGIVYWIELGTTVDRQTSSWYHTTYGTM